MTTGIATQDEREFDVLSALVTFPLRGIWSARIEVDADDDEPLTTGATTFVLGADNEGEPIELVGTIVEIDVSTFEGRATAIMVGGAGTLASFVLPARTYQQAPFEVPVTSIVTDAIVEAGEDFEDDVALVGLTVSRWHRIAGTSARLLDRLAERTGFSWRLADDGRVAFFRDEWPEADELDAGLLIEGPEDARDRTLAGTVARASIRPGTTVRGRRLEEVHYMLDSNGLRTLLRWGDGNGAGGLRGDIECAARNAGPQFAYYCPHEVTVRRQNQDGTLDVDADDVSIGGVTAVPYYPGIIGCRMIITEDTRALLAFIDGDESKPCIIGFERFPRNPEISGNGVAIARVNDPTQNGTLSFSAVAGSGGIASIAVTYTPPFGPPQVVTVVPGTPVSIDLAGTIQDGSPEVRLRANP